MKNQHKNTLPTTQSAGIVAARGVSDENGLAQYIQDIQKFPILTAQQEYEYATKWSREHDSVAAEKLVASHLRMVVSVAYDFKNYGMAEGSEGGLYYVRNLPYDTYLLAETKAELEAAATAEDANTIEDVYEPYLLQLGFIQRTSRGRVCLKKAYEHLGLPVPEDKKVD